MRTALAVAVGAVLASGCGGGGCPEAHELTVEGEPAPHADLVLRVAQEHCDRPIVGHLEWRTGVTISAHDGYLGYCHFGAGCPMDAWVASGWTVVERDPEGNVTHSATAAPRDATETSLAHEIGHWCLDSDDETAVKAWALSVNLETRTFIEAP